MKASSRSLLPLALVGVGILVLDQISKEVVLHALGPDRSAVVIPGLFSLVCNFNTGAAFGLFQESQTVLALVSVIAMVILPFLIRASLREGIPTLGSHGLTAILAGDVGNLVDRLFRDDGVVDFLYIHLGNPQDPIVSWFPFNIADAAICVGVGLYLVNSYLAQRRKPPTPDQAS